MAKSIKTEQRYGPQRVQMLHVRIDIGLFLAAMKKARRYGGISPVVRAMLRRFITTDEPNFDLSDLEQENTPAERPGRPPKVAGN